MTMAAVSLEIIDVVALITLNDPDRRNVLSAGMVDGIVETIDLVETGDARALVITGAGSAFCAGAELSGLEAGISGDFEQIEHVYRAFLRVKECVLPTIAAVNGPAVGAGMNLALACDIRLASDRARFDSRFVSMQLNPGGGHSWMLARAIGLQGAMAMAVLGETVDGARAREIGLAWAEFPSEELVGEAVRLASRIGGHDREFIHNLTATVRHSAGLDDHDTAVAYERFAQRWSIGQPSFASGIAALSARIMGTKQKG